MFALFLVHNTLEYHLHEEFELRQNLDLCIFDGLTLSKAKRVCAVSIAFTDDFEHVEIVEMFEVSRYIVPK